MKRIPDQPQLVLDAPELAIDTYLASLLGEVDEAPEGDNLPPDGATAKVVKIRRPVESSTVKPDMESPVTGETHIQAAEIARSADSVEERDTTVDQGTLEQVPAWAQQPFQSLLFSVRGMTLAVPLEALNSIAECNQELRQLPGQPDWCMGVLLHRGDRVVVVDTAQLVMPERLSRAADESRVGSHILIIGDGRWGLACDRLQPPMMLDRERVRWRRGSGERPWMAGTIIDKLCALLDVEALLKMVQPASR